jgi:hypothetical protein
MRAYSVGIVTAALLAAVAAKLYQRKTAMSPITKEILELEASHRDAMDYEGDRHVFPGKARAMKNKAETTLRHVEAYRAASNTRVDRAIFGNNADLVTKVQRILDSYRTATETIAKSPDAWTVGGVVSKAMGGAGVAAAGIGVWARWQNANAKQPEANAKQPEAERAEAPRTTMREKQMAKDAEAENMRDDTCQAYRVREGVTLDIYHVTLEEWVRYRWSSDTALADNPAFTVWPGGTRQSTISVHPNLPVSSLGKCYPTATPGYSFLPGTYKLQAVYLAIRTQPNATDRSENPGDYTLTKLREWEQTSTNWGRYVGEEKILSGELLNKTFASVNNKSVIWAIYKQDGL